MRELQREDLLEIGTQKTYGAASPIDGVQVFPLSRHVDDRGLFLELYRKTPTHAGSENLAAFFIVRGAAGFEERFTPCFERLRLH